MACVLTFTKFVKFSRLFIRKLWQTSCLINMLQCNCDQLSRNAPERHAGSFWKGGTPNRNFWRRPRRNARRLTTSCRL